MEEPKRAFGYLCPVCGKAVYAERTYFAMTAGAMDVICECGKSSLHMDNDGLHYHLQVPCGICGGTHDATLDEKALFSGRGVGLACAKSQQLCCFIGWPEEVQNKIDNLAVIREKEREHEQEDGGTSFADETIMYEVLSELKDIAGRDGISCSCGSKKWGMKVRRAAVDLICKDCGGVLRIPAATDADLDDLCCQMKLKIKGV